MADGRSRLLWARPNVGRGQGKSRIVGESAVKSWRKVVKRNGGVLVACCASVNRVEGWY